MLTNRLAAVLAVLALAGAGCAGGSDRPGAVQVPSPQESLVRASEIGPDPLPTEPEDLMYRFLADCDGAVFSLRYETMEADEPVSEAEALANARRFSAQDALAAALGIVRGVREAREAEDDLTVYSIGEINRTSDACEAAYEAFLAGVKGDQLTAVSRAAFEAADG